MWWCKGRQPARLNMATSVSSGFRPIFSGVWLSVLIVFAAGCGFHLRGATGGLSAGDVSVSGVDPGNALAQALTARGATQAPRFEVSIQNETWDRRVSAFGSDGRAIEYELKYDVSYSLRELASGRVGSSDTVRVLRFYGFDPSQPLAKSGEETSIRADMVREAAASLLRRAASWGRTR